MDKIIMKIKYTLIGLLIVSAHTFAATLPPQAENVLNRYIESMVNGNTAGLNSVLGGKLLEKRKVLHGKPEYELGLRDAHRDAHRDAQYEILSITELAEDTLQVDVKLRYTDQTIRVMRLIMVNEAPSGVSATRYRIHARIDDAVIE